MLKALPVEPPPKPAKEMEVLAPMLAYTPVPRKKRIQCSEMAPVVEQGLPLAVDDQIRLDGLGGAVGQVEVVHLLLRRCVPGGLLHEHDELLPRDLAALELWHLRLACALHHADCREERLAINKEW